MIIVHRPAPTYVGAWINRGDHSATWVTLCGSYNQVAADLRLYGARHHWYVDYRPVRLGGQMAIPTYWVRGDRGWCAIIELPALPVEGEV